jgi:hypothetical protein
LVGPRAGPDRLEKEKISCLPLGFKSDCLACSKSLHHLCYPPCQPGILKICVSRGFHTCNIYSSRASKKHFYLGPSVILFTEDTKMWMIHVYILEMFVILN